MTSASGRSTHAFRVVHVEARRVTDANGLDVARWCRGGWYPDQGYVDVDAVDSSVYYDRDNCLAYVGDWVVRTDNPGNLEHPYVFVAVSDGEFRKRYEFSRDGDVEDRARDLPGGDDVAATLDMLANDFRLRRALLLDSFPDDDVAATAQGELYAYLGDELRSLARLAREEKSSAT